MASRAERRGNGMTKADTFATIMETLAENFRVVLTTPATRGYWMVMEDLTEAEMAKAAKAALGTCKFMPSAAELLAFAGHAPRDLTAEATMAWDAVRNAMDKLDVYGNVDFGPLINAVVRNLGGWLYLCESTLPELEWRRKDFERVYRAWADKDPAMFDGSPHFGEWKNAPITQIQVPGMPVRRPALEAVQTPQAKAMRDVVRELANEKSLAVAPVGAGQPVRNTPVPPRETKQPIRITEEEKAAALAKINAHVATRQAAEATR